jgi:uncharacterized protein YggU (UPF0235/DUF167 family)
MVELTAHPEGTILAVRAQAGAKHDRILGERAGALRVAVSATPERGKANEAIRSVLAEAIPCKASQIGLVSGETSREKRFLIAGLTPDELRPRIDVLVKGVGSSQ